MDQRWFSRALCACLALALVWGPAPGLAAPPQTLPDTQPDVQQPDTQQPDTQPDTQQPTGFSLSFAQQTVTVALGGTLTETAAVTAEPADAAVSVTGWQWQSADPDILKVEGQDENAVYTPVSVGQTTVTVTARAQTASGEVTRTAQQTVTVTPAAATSVTVSPSVSVTLEPTGEHSRQVVTAAVAPEGADSQSVEWTVADPKVASVSPASGSQVTLSAVAPGKTTLVAASGGVSSLPVDVEVSGLLLSDRSIALKVGQSCQLAASGRYGGASGNAAVQWESSSTGIAAVDSTGSVNAQRAGTAVITASVNGYTATCTVEVSENTANVISGSAASGQPFAFSTVASALDSRCQTALGSPLDFVSGLSVKPAQGILYYGYVSADDPGYGVGAVDRFYRFPQSGQRALSDLCFVPAPGFDGTAVITYSGYNAAGQFFTGSISLSVSGDEDLSYSAAAGQLLTLSASDFSALCVRRTGRDLDYVSFELPPASSATLYYNYTGTGGVPETVTAGTPYYLARSPYLGSVSLLPASDYAGTLRIAYRAVDTAGNAFSGALKVTVAGRSDTSAGEVSYTVEPGGFVHLRGKDFDAACREATGSGLDYIRLTLPSGSQGALYYRYGATSQTPADTGRYYLKSSPFLGDLTFVAADALAATVTIPFTGYTASGASFSGRLTIRVQGGSALRVISYAAPAGTTVAFDADDFNEACLDAAGASLRYVTFTLPAKSQGALYYNYRESTQSGTAVRASTRFYRSSSPSISSVRFVPASGYANTVSISFTGEDTQGGSLSGRVDITLTAPQTPVVRYAGTTGYIGFRLSDFDDACRSATGYGLSHVQFTSLPASSQGRLYVGYAGPLSQGARVTTGSYYYASGAPQLAQVGFMPHAGAQGTVTIGFTGVDTRGGSFSGRVEITPAADLSSSFTDMAGYAWAIGSVDYLYGLGVVQGVGGSRFGPGQSISRGDFVLMLCRALGLTSTQTSSGFSDVPAGSYYAQAIAAARALGVVQGDERGRFSPNAPLQRQDALVMLQRAMNAAGLSTQSAAGSLSAFADGAQVAGYARTAVAQLYGLGVVQGDEQGRLLPLNAVTRAEMAVMLHRVLTL